MFNVYEQQLQQYEGQLMDVRRHLHRIPQNGLQQYKTSSYIRSYIAQHIPNANILQPFKDCPTAIIAQISNNKSQEKYLLRCELDALKMKQDSGLEYAAEGQYHHACGHDGHMAAMLIAMRIISNHINDLCASIVFVFQPGQEGKKGAYYLLKAYPQLLDKIDYCFALHLGNHLKVGQIGIPFKYATCNSNRFEIVVKGKSAHSMTPENGVDANYIGCSLVGHLYALKARIIPPLQKGCLNIFRVQGGEVIPTISQKMSIFGTVRSSSPLYHSKLIKEIQNLSKSYCESFGAEATFSCNESINIIQFMCLSISLKSIACDFPNQKQLIKDYKQGQYNLVRYVVCWIGFLLVFLKKTIVLFCYRVCFIGFDQQHWRVNILYTLPDINLMSDVQSQLQECGQRWLQKINHEWLLIVISYYLFDIIIQIMSKKELQEIDPSIYQYDEIYDQIKNKPNNKTKTIQKQDKQNHQKKQSKYISKMKARVQARKNQHQEAQEKIMRKQNQKLGISKQQVFVTQSYLEKQKQQKLKCQKEKKQQQFDKQYSVDNMNLPISRFTNKLLDDHLEYNRRK